MDAFDPSTRAGTAPIGSRRIACERCGRVFACQPDRSGRCWCGAEPYRPPMPLPSEVGAFGDCLCPACLREVTQSLLGLRRGQPRQTG